jgi:hypothetical protein
MLDGSGKLSIAELAIYLPLLFLALFSLFKHGWHGVLGWLYLAVFCGLRIVGSALLINSEKEGTTSTAGQTISGVGLSPLILALAGVLHES